MFIAIENDASENYDDYLTELRKDVCTRCIERRAGAPPCAPQGKPCGIEMHVPALVGICRQTESVQMADYLELLHTEICEHCSNKDGPTCPCPLDYLLQLAVEAIERVERRRRGMEAGVNP